MWVLILLQNKQKARPFDNFINGVYSIGSMIGREKVIGHTYTDRMFTPATLPYVRVRYRQEMHLKMFYIMLHDWFIHEGWVLREDSSWPEHYFLVRENPNLGNEMWLWWRFKKVPPKPEGGANSYYRWDMDIFWHVTGIKDIEVMKQGNKFKTNYADLELVIEAKVELDYNKEWRVHPLLKHVHPFFVNRIFKADIEKHRDELYREVYKLQETIKSFLGMRRYMPTTEGSEFWPTLGSGDKEGLLPTSQ